MNIRNCEKCGKIYNYIGRDICPECTDDLEKEFDVLRKYIRKHPGCTLQDVTENTSISPEKVLAFLREGRLTGPVDSAELKCASCGASIPYGKLCDRCQADLGREISMAVSGAKKETRETGDARHTKHKMHTR